MVGAGFFGALGGKVGFLGGQAAAFNKTRKIETGSMLLDLITLQDMDGKYIEYPDAKNGADVYGYVSAAIEILPMRQLLKNIPGFKSLTKTGIKAAIKNLVKDKTKKQIVRNIAADFALGVTYEGVQEALQELVSVGVSEGIKSDYNKNKGYNFAEPPEILSRVATAGLEGAKAAIGMTAPFAGIRTYADIRTSRSKSKLLSQVAEGKAKEQKAIADSIILDKVQEQVARLDNAEGEQVFFQTATKGTIYKDIFINPEDGEKILSDLLQNKKVPQNDTRFWQDMQEQIQTGKELGNNIHISFADFITNIMPYPDMYNSFRPYIKTYAEGMTLSAIEARKSALTAMIEQGKKAKAEKNLDFDYAYKAYLESEQVGNIPPLQRKEIAEANAFAALGFARETGKSVQEIVAISLPQYSYEIRANPTAAKNNMVKIVAAITKEAKDGQDENLIKARKLVARKDVNAIAKTLKNYINNPTDADTKAYIRTLEAISDMRLNITNMNPNEVLNKISEYNTKPDGKIVIERSAEDKDKSGILADSEIALKNLTAEKGDYIAAGGGRIPISYEIKELSDIITSDKENYPAKYQPRDRSRSASDAQINQITSAFVPERVGKNVIVNEGAPIITSSGNFVLVGNGRSMAINRLYEENNADIYKQYLANEGFNTEGFTRPVLIRRLLADLDDTQLKALVDVANTTSAMMYSASENALRDAAKLTGNIIDTLDISAELNAAANKKFRTAFFNDIIPSAERNAYLDKDDKITGAGIARIENALVGLILPDTKILSVLLENPDNNIRKVTSGLAKSAPAIIFLENEIASGRVSGDYSLLTDTAAAVLAIKAAKDKNMPIDMYLAQASLLDAPLPLSAKYLTDLFKEASISDFTDKIDEYVRMAANEGDTRQDDMFGGKRLSKPEILAALSGDKVPMAQGTELYQTSAKPYVLSENMTQARAELTEREDGPSIAPDDTIIKAVVIPENIVPAFKTKKELRLWLTEKFNDLNNVVIKSTGNTVLFNSKDAKREIKNSRKKINNAAYPVLSDIVEQAEYSGFRAADDKHRSKVKGQDVYHSVLVYKDKPYAVEFYVDISENK